MKYTDIPEQEINELAKLGFVDQHMQANKKKPTLTVE